MIYAGILAAGLGTRMHRQDLPKQFLPLGEKPLIIHTLEQFYINPSVDRVIVVAPEEWLVYTEDLLKRYDSMGKEYCVISGGVNKTESIYKLTQFIGDKWGVSDNDILVAHDAIRPFVTQNVIDENISIASKYGAANTAMRTNDAILVSQDGSLLNEIPPHEHLYAEQTPQSYSLVKLSEIFQRTVTNGVKLESETELPRLYISTGNEMRLVHGDYSNIKIINPYDLAVANALLMEREKQ
jgi:2-C-methyl-D-erythritol 4-phosphate cytidylyltransferase